MFDLDQVSPNPNPGPRTSPIPSPTPSPSPSPSPSPIPKQDSALSPTSTLVLASRFGVVFLLSVLLVTK
eukprot:scaffold96823_cov27-Phaeocystis_antarctica.AAC.1